MLPGFRFLLAAIALCVSILVFGLGAAALLRSAHEEFAQNPSWRAAPEPRFAQSEEMRGPVLAMLRVEPAASERKAEPKIATDAPANALPSLRAAPDDAPVTASAADEIAAPVQETSLPVEIAKAEPSKTETSPAETSSEQTSTPAEIAPASIMPTTAAAVDTKIAAVEQASSATSEQPAAAAQAMTPTAAAAEPDPATTKVAKLDGRPVVIEPDAQLEKEAIAEVAAEQDREAAKKRLRAERAKERRRLAARRARQAKQAIAPQPALDLFGQQMQVTQQTAPVRRTR